MSRLLIVSILLVASVVNAKEEWLCTEASSKKVGDSILACGIGLGTDENLARSSAFDNAKSEFSKICDLSDDCKNHGINVEPKRTTCDLNSGQYKCYRMLEFTILDKTKIETNLDNNGFGSFYYSDTPENPKLKKGLTKAQVLKMFGAPFVTTKGSSDQINPKFRIQSWGYSGNMCVANHCVVSFSGEVVSHFEDFKPSLTDTLSIEKQTVSNSQKGSAIDKTELRNKCQKNDRSSCYALGNISFEEGDAKNAHLFFDKGCRLGDGDSCDSLGSLEFNAKKKEEAYGLYKKACKLGSHEGCRNLAANEDVKGNEVESNRLWKMLCDRGDEFDCASFDLQLNTQRKKMGLTPFDW